MIARLTNCVCSARSWIWLPVSIVLGFSGCDDSDSGGRASEAVGTGVVRADIEDADFEAPSAPRGSGGGVESFAVRGRNIRYDEEDDALVVDLSVVNLGEATHSLEVSLTFESLLPTGITVLNPDNDRNGPGASIDFEFADGDDDWTTDEESLPRETRFGVDEGTSIAFVARIDAGINDDAGAIGGIVWNDADGDGVMDNDEGGVGGVTIELLTEGADPISTETDDDGSYRFDDLDAGLYEVVKKPLDGFVSTTSTVIDVILVETDGSVSSFLAANFGCRDADDSRSGIIGGIIWYDDDEDGELDDDEEGIEGARVLLTGEGIDDQIARSDSDGVYEFDGLDAGTYTVRKLPTEGLTPTTPTRLHIVLVASRDDEVGSFFEADFGCVEGEDETKVCLCHIPPGNPENKHTICVGAAAVPAHLAHGDTLGECGSGERMCDDGIDNDQDGNVDCDDPDCDDSVTCDLDDDMDDDDMDDDDMDDDDMDDDDMDDDD